MIASWFHTIRQILAAVMFPGLLSAAEQIRIGLLQATPDPAIILANAGVTLTVISVSWDRFEPAVGIHDPSYLAGQTPPEKNGEIQRGFDFARFIGGTRDPRVGVHCTWLDADPSWSDETSPDPVRWSLSTAD
jgi:hypothetical protein